MAARRAAGTYPISFRPAAYASGVRILAAGLIAAGFATCATGGDVEGANVPQATLRLQRVFVGNRVYIEGALWGLRVRRPGSISFAALQAEVASDGPVSFTLSPGSYRLESYSRPCDGNCANLDPPTDRCSRRIVLRGGRQLRAVVRVSPGRPCGIVI